MFFIYVSFVFLIKLRQHENKGALINNEKVNQATYDEKRNLRSGGIRTHASEETGAFNQRLRSLGHATRYVSPSNSYQFTLLQNVLPRSTMNTNGETEN